jgi:catechol 2,3-dioxygenase-like lactoylglutathione lyase family enzyme
VSRNPNISFSHIAVCVSDMERSSRFYTEALGFVHHHSVAAGAPYGKLVELEAFKYRASFFKLPGQTDGPMLELFALESPGTTGSKERRPMNQLGLTHLSLIIDDLDTVLDRIIKCGGCAYPQTKVETDKGEIIFCTDPDGIRVELWRRAT